MNIHFQKVPDNYVGDYPGVTITYREMDKGEAEYIAERLQGERRIRLSTAIKISERLSKALDLLAEMDLALTVATEANGNLPYGWAANSPFQQKIYELQLKYREFVGDNDD